MSLDNERLDGGSLGVSPADGGTHGLSIGTSLISFTSTHLTPLSLQIWSPSPTDFINQPLSPFFVSAVMVSSRRNFLIVFKQKK